MKSLDQRLWLEGNLSVGYGKELNGNIDDIFSLRFEPCEVEKALDIPLDSVNVEVNTWFPGLFREKPSIALCFPYEQHFLSDSPGSSSQIMNREDLIKEVERIDFSKINVFNTKAIKKMFITVSILNSILIIVLLIILLI